MSQQNTAAQTLNTILANANILQQKLRNYHWNVTGEDFFELHEKFEILYTRWAEHIDELAERIKMLKERPYSTLSEFLEHGSLHEELSTPSSRNMVKHITHDLRKVRTYILDAVEAAEAERDRGSVNVLDDMLDLLEKDVWMLEAWLEDSSK